MTKGNVGRVISAETGSANCDSMATALPPRKIEHVMHDHIFIGVMSAHTVGRMDWFVVKAFQIDCVRAVHRNSACIDKRAHRANDSEILVLVVTAERSWKDDQRESTAISEGEQLKFTTQPGRVPPEVTFIHLK